MNCDGTGTKFTVNYTNQIGVIGGDFSGEGDSGSLIVTQDTATPVALLYAGSDTDTVGNPVADVLNFFASGGNNVTFVGGGPHAGRWVHATHCPAIGEDRGAKLPRDASYPESHRNARFTCPGIVGVSGKFRPSAWAKVTTIPRRPRFCFL